LCILSGILFSLAFPPYNLWLLAYVAFFPLLLTAEENNRQNFLLGFICGLTFYSISLFWLISVAGFIYILLPVYLSLFWGIFLYMVFSLSRRGRIFLAACIWFLLEIIIANFLTGFPWLSLGLSQWNNPPVAETARFFGIYGISFILILSNFTVFYAFKRKNLFSSCLAVVFLCSVLYAAVHIRPADTITGRINILMLQLGLPVNGNNVEERINRLIELTQENITADTELVIWPESSFSANITDYNDLLHRLENFTHKTGTALILGAITGKENENFNSALFIKNGKTDIYNKRHLVPYGEFIPGGRVGVIRDIYRKLAGDYLPSLKKGENPVAFKLGKAKIHPLICFENVFPYLLRDYEGEDPCMFVVITNDSWFGETAGPYQHFAHNVLRAAESGKYLVQVALSGISGVVSPHGNVVETINRQGKQLFISGFLRTKVPVTKEKTFYAQVGDKPLFIFSLILSGVLLCRRK
jgi:apolipoprotein N-acyltransferase